MVEKDWPDWAVDSACKEAEVGTWGVVRWGSDDFGRYLAAQEVNFWEANVFLRVEAFGGVGVAEDSDGCVVEEGISLRCNGTLQLLEK